MITDNYERMYKETVTAFFDGRTSYDNDATIERALPLLEKAELKGGQHVLDVATGTGIIAIAAAQKVGPAGKVTGVDFSAGMLQQAQCKSEALSLSNIEWIEADADYLDYPAESFDAIFCSSALVYLQDILQTLKSWYSWLKPGGTVVFSAWSARSYPAPWIVAACDRHGITLHNINAPTGSREKCLSLMQTTGFDDIAVHEQQLGRYKPVEQLSGWTGTWFHPYENPLADISQEQLQSIIAEFHRIVLSEATEQGVWCESLAYYVSGKKLRP